MPFIRIVLFLAALLAASAGAQAGPVDINSADAETLAGSIDGVGTQKAVAIIRYREANGPFASVDDLAKVQGIGIKTVDRNRDRLTAGKPER